MEKFNKGDVVKVRQDIKNRPNMVVEDLLFKKVKIDGESKDILYGVKCFWFTDNFTYQSAVISHRDLVIVKSNIDD